MKKWNRLSVVGAGLLGGAMSVGVLSVALADKVWETGFPRYTFFNGAATYLGFSAGPISAAAPQRWAAVPFDLAAPATIHKIETFAFEPLGLESDDFLIKIWNRPPDTGAGDPSPPLAANQVGADIIVPRNCNPTGMFDAANDDPNDPNEAQFRWQFAVDVDLPAGRYYLTVAANTPTVAGAFPNLAWFANAPGATPPVLCTYDSIFFMNTGTVAPPPPGGNPPPYPYMWRCATFPAPGFAAYDVASATYMQDPGFPTDGTCEGTVDLTDLYQETFILHKCPGDIDPPATEGDSLVGLGDLALMLGNFGSTGHGIPGDLDVDCDVDLGDLARMLGEFGNVCP